VYFYKFVIHLPETIMQISAKQRNTNQFMYIYD